MSNVSKRQGAETKNSAVKNQVVSMKETVMVKCNKAMDYMFSKCPIDPALKTKYTEGLEEAMGNIYDGTLEGGHMDSCLKLADMNLEMYSVLACVYVDKIQLITSVMDYNEGKITKKHLENDTDRCELAINRMYDQIKESFPTEYGYVKDLGDTLGEFVIMTYFNYMVSKAN